jgi:glycosyltransferase involved in cell wall biosynthesis
MTTTEQLRRALTYRLRREGLVWRSLRAVDGMLLPFKRLDLGAATDNLVLDTDPIVLITHWETHHLRLMRQVLPRTRAYVLFFLWWTHETGDRVRLLRREYHRYVKERPEHRILFLCNTSTEASLLSRAGIPSVHCNHNAFLDERLYRPLPAVKRFDAVYNSRLEPFKRHALARQVRSLAILTYGLDESPVGYVREVRQMLAHAEWLNFPAQDGYRLIPREEIPRHLASARVGLCLSAEEGAMYASGEYLLCRLPIVSTRSKGGRDVFFDDEYVAIVDDTPEAVAAGVERMVRLSPDPEYIRNRTIEKLRRHRDLLIDSVQRIYDAEGVGRRFGQEFPARFTNRMLGWHRWSDISRRLNAATAGG